MARTSSSCSFGPQFIYQPNHLDQTLSSRPAMMSEAGPSRPRKPSTSSGQNERDYRNTTPGTSVFDVEAYDEDADDLPSYSMPGPSDSAEQNHQGRGGRRSSQERLLRESQRGSGERDIEPGRPISRRGSGLGAEEQLREMDSGQGTAKRKAAWWKSTLITAIFVIGW